MKGVGEHHVLSAAVRNDDDLSGPFEVLEHTAFDTQLELVDADRLAQCEDLDRVERIAGEVRKA
jgi:hypothetical protein